MVINIDYKSSKVCRLSITIVCIRNYVFFFTYAKIEYFNVRTYISENRIRIHYTLRILEACQNRRPWMTLKGNNSLCYIMRLSTRFAVKFACVRSKIENIPRPVGEGTLPHPTPRRCRLIDPSGYGSRTRRLRGYTTSRSSPNLLTPEPLLLWFLKFFL